ncbi:MAG: hypothetical protein AAGG38_10855 [Planctomycetota bacterium]
MSLPETVTVNGEIFRVEVGGTCPPGIFAPVPLPEISGVENPPQDLRRGFVLPGTLDDHELQNALERLMQAVRDREPWTLPVRH